MTFDEILNLILSIMAGLVTGIPLVVGLIRTTQKAVKEKNWTELLSLIMKYMEEAEVKFSEGAERKEWVMAMVKISADSLNYDVDYDAVSAMIDAICEMTKKVNPPALEVSK